jgi:hypothetical protein
VLPANVIEKKHEKIKKKVVRNVEEKQLRKNMKK